MSFAFAKVHLNSILQACQRHWGVQILDISQGLGKTHLIDFFAIDGKEYLLCTENVADSNGCTFSFEVDIDEIAEINFLLLA